MWIFTSFYSKFEEIIILKKGNILIGLHVCKLKYRSHITKKETLKYLS